MSLAEARAEVEATTPTWKEREASLKARMADTEAQLRARYAAKEAELKERFSAAAPNEGYTPRMGELRQQSVELAKQLVREPGGSLSCVREGVGNSGNRIRSRCRKPLRVGRILSEGSSLSPAKGLHHQRSSSHAMVPLSDASPHPEGRRASEGSSKFGHLWTGGVLHRTHAACCRANHPPRTLEHPPSGRRD